MSYISNIAFRDSGNLDAFGRLRVSEPTGLWASSFEYNKQPVLFEEIIVGTGSATHTPNTSSTILSTGGTANLAEATLQSRQYIRYQPGKSQLVLITFEMGTSQTNCVKEVSYGDARNGIIFRDNGGQLQIAVRTYTSGAAVETVINQADWNIDPMIDGSGISGITLDITKSLIFWVDLEWLGVGRVRCGFNVDGVSHVCHQNLHSNRLTNVYMGTANLPIRYTIKNDGVAGGTGVMRAICSAVSSEGGFSDELGFGHSHHPLASVSVGAASEVVLAIIRPKLTFNGLQNRQLFALENVSVLSSGDAAFSVYWNPTITGGVWADIDTVYSGMEYQSTLGTIAGGIRIFGDYVGSSGGRASVSRALSQRYPITIDAAGAASYAIAVAAQSASGTINMRGGLNWKEVR